MHSSFRFSRILWLVVCASIATLYLLPVSNLDARGQVAIEALRVLLCLTLMILCLGCSVSWLLVPASWKKYEWLVIPLLGVVVFMPVAYLLNFFVDMRLATILLVAATTPIALWRLLFGHLSRPIYGESAIPLFAALGLLVMALLPHIWQGSLGLLAQTADEEGYFGVAQYLLAYPAGADTPGPLSPVFGHLTSTFRSEGWGFYYLIAAGSALSGVPPFSTNLPVIYLLLALSVLAWYLLFREAFGLSHRWAGAAVTLYAVNGLPLWFAEYGYGRQIAWLALAPLVLSALSLVIREGSRRSIALAGIVTGAFLLTETRLGLAHLATVAAGISLYWLFARRDAALIARLITAGAIALFIAVPVLWYFTQNYFIEGALFNSFDVGDDGVVSWGPNVANNFPIEQLLGLEPTELSRIREPNDRLSWLNPVDEAMSAVSGYLVWLLFATASLGVLVAVRQNMLLLAMVAGFFVWVALTGTVLRFPYGYFKLFAVGAPLILGFAVMGAKHLWTTRPSGRPATFSFVTRRRVLVAACILVSLFFFRNTVHSLLFNARGWGISMSPAIVRAVADLGNHTEPGSRVYLSGFAEYPLKDNNYVIREGHRLALRSREETRMWWSSRLHGMIASSLIGRHLYGVFRTEVWNWSNTLPDDDYDYYVLTSDEDPRIRGLDVNDVVSVAGEIILYRSPGDARAGSERILANRGTLRVDEKNPLLFTAGSDALAFSSIDVGQLGSARGRVRIALLSLNETTVTVSLGGVSRRLVLDPGLSWYTTPTVDLPAQIGVVPSGGEPLRVIALRLLPPGDEDLDRCADSILSTEIVKTDGGIDVELWLSNPMRDASKAFATIVVEDSQIPKWKLPMEVSGRGQSLSLHFPLDAEASRSVRDGVEIVSAGEFPWLTSGGGLLQLRFELGHERPRVTPLANVLVADGKIERFDRYVDPVQHRLWGHDDRPQEKQPPDAAALEGELVRSADSLHYVVSGGRRCWVPDPADAGFTGEAKLLTPEQLWLIPPGLPLEIR